MIFSLILLVISCSLLPTAAAATLNLNTASDDSLDITVFKSMVQRLERLEETVNIERQEWQQERGRWEEERKEWLTIKQEASAMLQTLKDMKPNTETSPRTSGVRYDSHDRSRRNSAAAALAALGDEDFDQLLKTLQRVLKDVSKIEKEVDRVKDQADKSRENLETRMGAVENTANDQQGSLDEMKGDVTKTKRAVKSTRRTLEILQQNTTELNATTNNFMAVAASVIVRMLGQLTGLEYNVTQKVDHEISQTHIRQHALQQNVKVAVNAVNDSVMVHVQNLFDDLGFTARSLFQTNRAVEKLTNTTDSVLERLDSRVTGEVSSLQHDIIAVARSMVKTTQTLQDHELKTLTDMHAMRDELEADMGILINKVTASIHAVMSQVDTKMQRMERLGSIQNEVPSTQDSASRSTFIRWGRSVCPGSAELVYSGVTGGGANMDSGASSSVLCLPTNPILEDLPGIPVEHTDLEGAEFTINHQTHHDVMCAVCSSPQPTTIMMPATNKCQTGWSLQYSGYLMGGKAGNDYVCVDSSLEGRMHSSGTFNEGLMLFYTLAKCGGSLPCNAYQDGQAVTCVVCSK